MDHVYSSAFCEWSNMEKIILVTKKCPFPVLSMGCSVAVGDHITHLPSFSPLLFPF